MNREEELLKRRRMLVCTRVVAFDGLGPGCHESGCRQVAGAGEYAGQQQWKFGAWADIQLDLALPMVFFLPS
jgi:hypothetical protein